MFSDRERIAHYAEGPRRFMPGFEAMHCMTAILLAEPLLEQVAGTDLAPQDYGTHSLRRMKASIIYMAMGNLRTVQILLGHGKIDSTARYLDVDVEDTLEPAERTEV